MQTCDTVNELSVDMQAALIVFFSVVIGCFQCECVSIMMTLKQTHSVEPSAFLMEGNGNKGTSEGQTHTWIALCDIIRGIAQIVSFFSLATL